MQKLNTLFLQMARLILRDIYRVKKGAEEGANCSPEMEEPDFLHEALQRLIFNFLIEHEREAFMNLETGPTRREPNTRSLPLAVPKFSIQGLSGKKRPCNNGKVSVFTSLIGDLPRPQAPTAIAVTDSCTTEPQFSCLYRL
jgi:hypothetical protein